MVVDIAQRVGHMRLHPGGSSETHGWATCFIIAFVCVLFVSQCRARRADKHALPPSCRCGRAIRMRTPTILQCTSSRCLLIRLYVLLSMALRLVPVNCSNCSWFVASLLRLFILFESCYGTRAPAWESNSVSRCMRCGPHKHSFFKRANY
jgi:hypothetical protein